MMINSWSDFISCHSGSSEDGLSGSGGTAGHGLCAVDYSGGGGGSLEGAR